MSQPVISVENLSKVYRLGQIGTGTFTNDLKIWWARARGKPNPLLKIGQADHGNRRGEEIWALNDVSFTVEQGEALGIIGRNGAGKSTLLKILSRVTAPTSGKIKVKGRVASLLEVGTGFHPELTGRENIYLNGAILGMTRLEVSRKLAEIVDFSGVEQFIDTPVKRYSSGMYVRLAFAVAAHLEPEILVVDEVLAVGDAEFQKKCLGKMGEVAKGGRTVLFVSHNMAAIRQLCDSTILINQGHLQQKALTAEVIDSYLKMNSDNSNSEADLDTANNRTGIGGAKIKRISINNSVGDKSNIIGIGEPLSIIMEIAFQYDFPKIVIGAELRNQNGTQILNLRSDSQNKIFGPCAAGEEVTFEISLPGLPLYPGIYLLEPWLCEYKGNRLDHVHNAYELTLESRKIIEAEGFIQDKRGILLVDCNWQSL